MLPPDGPSWDEPDLQEICRKTADSSFDHVGVRYRCVDVYVKNGWFWAKWERVV